MTEEERLKRNEAYREYCRTWVQNHKEERRAYLKEYYRKNKEKWGVATSPLQAILKEFVNEQYESSESD